MEQKKQRGFALPVTVFALVVVGVITTGGFFMAHQEGRIGVASEHAGVAFYLTERGLVDVMGKWNSLFLALPLWGDTTVTRDYSGLGQVTTRVTKMTESLYFLDVNATVTMGGAMMSGAARRVGVTVRVETADLTISAALTTRGPTSLQGTAEVHGEDEVPGAWGGGFCSGPLVDKPGILTDDATQVSTQGAAEITGNPDVEEDNTIDDDTFRQFGDLSWDDLTGMADITLSGGGFTTLEPDSTADGRCRTGQGFPNNWGNPENPGAACFGWFPIIHVTGNASIQSGGVGQGLLLVDGDLDLRGNFAFYGIIIVQGSMETQGSGNRVYGGVLASNADFDTQALVGGSVVTNSTCAVSRAISENASLTRARPLPSRSWVDLSAISES